MFKSQIIEVDGRFAGVAITVQDGFRFVAIDPRLEDLDAREFATLAVIRSAAAALLRRALHVPQRVATTYHAARA